MKTRFTWLGIVATVILGISSAFVSCENDLGDGHITYKGRVVSQTGNLPMADVTVRITNGTVVRASMMTQADGVFSLSVVVREIDETYYLELLDKNGQSKKGQLRAFGMAEYDYGDIPFGDVVPMVETIGLIAMSENSFTCKCNVRSQGNARVSERGLCWGTNIPSIEDYKIVSGSGMGEYSCVVENAGININTTTYYARAYAVNEYGVAYGEPIEINSGKLAYYSLPSMQYGGYTYHIHPDLGGMTWSQANAACQNLVAYGFSDWYLPNKEELVSIGAKSSALQKGNTYWASTPWGDYTTRHYCVVYSNSSNSWVEGNRDQYYDSNVFQVVPVRKDNGESYSGIVQQISGASDCESSNGWTWGNNGTATIGLSGDGGTFYYKDRSFSFWAKRSGEVTLEFKQNDANYNSWVCMWCNDAAAGTKYATSKEFTKVSLGNVSSNQLVYLCGTNVIIRKVKVE